MKSKNLFLAAMLMVYPSAMMAQQNVKKAFDALLKDNIVEIKTHVYTRGGCSVQQWGPAPLGKLSPEE